LHPECHDEERALKVLKDRWGYTAFRPGQWNAISAIISGRHVLAVLPTGSGKSICFQLPSLLRDGVAVVVSPLIALMNDQVQRLERRGVPSTSISSTLSRHEQLRRWEGSAHGQYKLLYIAPEQLKSEAFRGFAATGVIAFVAIDEAHCVSEWGHGFRPAFRQIARHLPDSCQIVAVTATATERVRNDIVGTLGMSRAVRVVTGFDRPNIRWTVLRGVNRRAIVSSVLGGGDVSIVYCSTRKGTDIWADWLRGRGIRASSYHAGMNRVDRNRAQATWTSGASSVMVATSAFGMGIDKADVRRVIHLGMPGSLSAYYQEAGRAGRDGLPSDATLLYRDADVPLQRAMIERTFVDELRHASARRRSAARRGKAAAIRNLKDIRRYVYSDGCRRHELLTYFGEAFSHRCGTCDTCVANHNRYATSIGEESAARVFANRIGEGRLAWNGIPALSQHDRHLLSGLSWSGLVAPADDLDDTVLLR
jgi:ATP-dependent DNA helicase RecQ